MRWAPNGESILLRCCTMQAKNKIYVGTDVVSAGSFYEGGEVAAKDLYGDKGGAEYDFVANARTEQYVFFVVMLKMKVNCIIPEEESVFGYTV